MYRSYTQDNNVQRSYTQDNNVQRSYTQDNNVHLYNHTHTQRGISMYMCKYISLMV